LIQDRYLNSFTIQELWKERSEESNDSEDEILELSIKIISQEDKSRPFKSEKNSKKTNAQERQERWKCTVTWENIQNNFKRCGTPVRQYNKSHSRLCGSF
jgi:hypothetical protein